MVAYPDESKGRWRAEHLPVAIEALHAREQQHPRIGGQVFGLLLHGRIPLAQHELRRTHDVGAAAFKHRARPFIVRGKGDGARDGGRAGQRAFPFASRAPPASPALFGAGCIRRIRHIRRACRIRAALEIRAHGLRRLVGIVVGGRNGMKRHAGLLEGVLGTTNSLALEDLHVAGSDGARLVQTQDVHARERLDAVELLHQHLALRQAHDGHGQHCGREQYQPLGNHSDKRRDGGEYGAVQLRVRGEKLAREQQRPDGKHDAADGLDDAV